MKIVKYIGIALVIFGAIFATLYFIKTNSKGLIEYETISPKLLSIEKKTVVTGKVIPEDEVEIKPQISGIIERLFVEEGDLVTNGDLLAKVKVVPNEQALNSAKGRLANQIIEMKNAKVDYDRNKSLFDKQIISKQVLESTGQDLTGKYVWLFIVGLIALMFKSSIEKLAAALFMFVGSDYKEDDVVYVDGKPGRIVRVELTKTVFFIYDVVDGKVVGGSKLVVQNERLASLNVEKPLANLDLSRFKKSE